MEGRRLKALEIPGYPHGYGNPTPPDSLTRVERILTIEITHTETIDGFEYFVFSNADYAWPPLPDFFWGGKTVRLWDDGFLVFRRNGQDLPLYDFSHPLEDSHHKITISGFDLADFPGDEPGTTGVSRRIKSFSDGINRFSVLHFFIYYPETVLT